MKKNNYNTVWIAPVHSPSLPLDRGFERGFNEFYQSDNAGGYLIEGYWKNAFEWLRKPKQKKFFLFLHTDKVHWPYTPSDESILKFTSQKNPKIVNSESAIKEEVLKSIIQDPSIAFTEKFIGSHQQLIHNFSLSIAGEIMGLAYNFSNTHTSFSSLYEKAFWKYINRTNKEDQEYVKLLYDAEIYELDQQIRDLLNILEEQKLREHTIIIITGDHGDEFFEHGNTGHNTIYEECTYVPLIIVGPNVPSGLKLDEPVESLDIMPTVLELLGIPPLPDAQGLSLVPLMEGKESYLSDRALYAENQYRQISIRLGEYKYILNYSIPYTDCNLGKGELFNLLNDPVELVNLESDEPALADSLKSRMIADFAAMEEKLKGRVLPKCTIK